MSNLLSITLNFLHSYGAYKSLFCACEIFVFLFSSYQMVVYFFLLQALIDNNWECRDRFDEIRSCSHLLISVRRHQKQVRTRNRVSLIWNPKKQREGIGWEITTSRLTTRIAIQKTNREKTINHHHRRWLVTTKI